MVKWEWLGCVGFARGHRCPVRGKGADSSLTSYCFGVCAPLSLRMLRHWESFCLEADKSGRERYETRLGGNVQFGHGERDPSGSCSIYADSMKIPAAR